METEPKTTSRRAFLQRVTFAAAAGSAFIACQAGSAEEAGAAAVARAGDDTCSDISGLTEKQIQTRKSLQYVDASPEEGKRCNNCRLFAAPEGDSPCGTCQVVPGPVHPKGYCIAWAAEA